MVTTCVALDKGAMEKSINQIWLKTWFFLAKGETCGKVWGYHWFSKSYEDWGNWTKVQKAG